jgi:uncharacterized protein
MNSNKYNYNLSTSSQSNKPGFDLFRSLENEQFYFHINDIDGNPTFFSEALDTVRKRKRRIEGVKKNAANPKMYKVQKEGEQYYFVLRAGNYQEMGRSKLFSSKIAMNKAIKYLSEYASTEQTGSTHYPSASIENQNKTMLAQQADEQFALKYSYQVHIYPNSEDKLINGRIMNTRTERKGIFTGLDGQAIVDFMAVDLDVKLPSVSLTSVKGEKSKTLEQVITNLKPEKAKKQPREVVLKEPPVNFKLEILNKKTRKPSNTLLLGVIYDAQLSPKENVKLKLPKTGEKIPLEFSIKAIRGSNFSNTWVENVELSSDGILRLPSLPVFPYPGIYRLMAKSVGVGDEQNTLRGLSVVNIL